MEVGWRWEPEWPLLGPGGDGLALGSTRKKKQVLRKEQGITGSLVEEGPGKVSRKKGSKGDPR